MEIEEINEPVDVYKNRLKAEHAENTVKAFQEFIAHAGVDAKQNAETVNTIRALEKEIAQNASWRSCWSALRVFCVLLVIVGFGGALLFLLPKIFDGFPNAEITPLWFSIFAVVSIASFAFIIIVLNKKISQLEEHIKCKRSERDCKEKEAWKQMSALNELFQWDTISKIIMKTLPIIKLDKYFSNARMNELINHFKLVNASTASNSMLFCQSGALNGNPFVICEDVEFRMGSQTYTGSLEISWQEQERYQDSDGHTKYRWVTKYQTLYASVDKPKPKYTNNKFVIYGNEAAPDLSFSRTPSELSSADGLFAAHNIKKAISKLEKESKKLKGFMIMSDKEFDALFNAVDRDHEVQFRLLFTPLAQREMRKLLQDKTEGYGDDFSFRKSRQINIVWPQHLMDIDISCSPAIFYNYELAEIQRRFIAYSNNYFRAFFFAFAPLLTIPLYQQHRSDLDIYRDVYGQSSSPWECETIANAFGEEKFKHPESITTNILKVKFEEQKLHGATQVAVTAHGFRGQARTDYISKYGNDGKWHDVPVEWIEYLPVNKTSPMVVRETGGADRLEFENKLKNTDTWQAFFRGFATSPDKMLYRRTIISFLPTK